MFELSEDKRKASTPVHEDPMVGREHFDVDEIMAKYDRESAVRSFTDYRHLIICAICVVFSLFQIFAGITARVPATALRPMHLAFVLLLAFLLYPVKKAGVRKNSLPWYDIVLALLAFGCCLYLAINHQDTAMRISRKFDPALDPIGYRTYVTDMTIAVMVILLLCEACRRVVGYPILIIAGLFVLYALFGEQLPPPFGHRPFQWPRIITHLIFTTEGIMGVPLGASATFIFLFVLFGAFLESTKVGDFFINLSNAIAGHKRGGPAKVAVLASALEGTVSGSSVANTVGSGSFTIPMMKSLGYRSEFAGAVEAAASTGGQIMPPVMGAAAFLMAESVGLPYSEVVKAAIVPAILYFSGIWIIVDLEAKKFGLRGMDKDKMPKLGKVLGVSWYLIMPLATIIYLLGQGYTSQYAALVSIMVAALCGMIRRIHNVYLLKKGKIEDTPEDPIAKTPLASLKQTAGDIVHSIINGPRSVLGVAIACGMAGIIVGMITLTGLGNRMGAVLIEVAGGNVLLTLIFTMLTSIILGMGVPTTANYLITSTVMAGAVMGVMGWANTNTYMLLTAHMFVFYFGIIADITPPVALAAMAGAAIAKGKPMQTGVNATKLAIAAFLVPYMFVFNPKMLMIDAHWWEVLQICVTALIGMVGVGACLEGYYSRHAHLLQRILFLIGGLMLIDPGTLTDIIGIGVIVVAVAWQELENWKFGGRMEPSAEYYKHMNFGQRVVSVCTESFVMIYKLITGKAA